MCEIAEKNYKKNKTAVFNFENILKEPDILESDKFREWIIKIGKRKFPLCKNCAIGAEDISEVYAPKKSD